MSQYPPNWDKKRKKVYRRDDHQCQKCGGRGGRRGNKQLHAHHRVPVSNGGNHDMNNLVTLCHSCHERVHGHRIPTNNDTRDETTPDISFSQIGEALGGLIALYILFTAPRVLLRHAGMQFPKAIFLLTIFAVGFIFITQRPSGTDAKILFFGGELMIISSILLAYMWKIALTRRITVWNVPENLSGLAVFTFAFGIFTLFIATLRIYNFSLWYV